MLLKNNDNWNSSFYSQNSPQTKLIIPGKHLRRTENYSIPYTYLPTYFGRMSNINIGVSRGTLTTPRLRIHRINIYTIYLW